MTIVEMHKKGKKKKYGYWLGLSQSEAIKIIHTISEQIEENSNNIGRKEFYLCNGLYFSIGVAPKNEEEYDDTR